MKNIYFLICLFLGLGAHAQPYETNPDFNRTRNWHFGEQIGLRFDPDTVFVVSSSIQTHEAAAVHTDQDGNLLLYSNGEKIWNANHEIIHNGNLALGHHSSNSGSVFVFQEDNPDSIYLFNTYYNISTTKEFSVNLIVREADTFRVVFKDSVLMYSVCEPIAVVKADNGKDIWITVHEFEANNLYSYLLTSQGIIACPVVSKSFSTPFGSPHAAYFTMIFSSDGNHMARVNTNLTVPITKNVELYSFHSGSGKFKFLYSLDSLIQPVTGLCFNRDNSYLYVTERDNDLVVFKFNPTDSLATIGSKNRFSLVGTKAKMQQMPYEHGIALMRLDNILGSSYIDFVVHINHSDSIKVLEKKINPSSYLNYVFPNFNQSYFYTPSINFTVKLNCVSNTIQFHGQDTFLANTHSWEISKHGISVITANIKNPLIEFTDTGVYTVRYIASNGVRSDTLTKEVTIFPKIDKNFLGSDTGWCESIGASLTLQAPNGMHCHEWSNGSTSSQITADTAGTYWAKVVTPNFCVLYDTITIAVDTVPAVPTIYRDNDTLKTDAISAKYQWLRYEQPIGTNKPFLTLSTTDTGVYSLRIRSNGGCTALSDTIHIPALKDTSTDNVNTIPLWEDIALYPNPAGDLLHIELKGQSVYEIVLADITGKAVYRHTAQAGRLHTIDVSRLSAGVYLVKLTSVSGTHTRRVVKE